MLISNLEVVLVALGLTWAKASGAAQRCIESYLHLGNLKAQRREAPNVSVKRWMHEIYLPGQIL